MRPHENPRRQRNANALQEGADPHLRSQHFGKPFSGEADGWKADLRGLGEGGRHHDEERRDQDDHDKRQRRPAEQGHRRGPQRLVRCRATGSAFAGGEDAAPGNPQRNQVAEHRDGQQDDPHGRCLAPLEDLDLLLDEDRDREVVGAAQDGGREEEAERQHEDEQHAAEQRRADLGEVDVEEDAAFRGAHGARRGEQGNIDRPHRRDQDEDQVRQQIRHHARDGGEGVVEQRQGPDADEP